MRNQISGVYKITNNLNGKFYIGSSVDINMRFTTHMGRDARNYQHKHSFYKDIIEYGRDNFTLDIIELCSREDLLSREQYYYDLLSPEYNKVRPAENNFMHEEVKWKASRNSNTPELVQKRKELYNSPEYQELFRYMHTDKMKPVDMIENNQILNTFVSMQEAARYISETTNFKGKNKTSKIKAVCDGERKSTYGYNWRYSKVQRLS